MLLRVSTAGCSVSIVTSLACRFLTASLTLSPVIGLVSVMFVPTRKQRIGSNDVLESDGPAVGSLHASERLHSVDVAIPRAAVDLVGADHLAHEFLEHIEVFVRATGGDEPAERIRRLASFRRRACLPRTYSSASSQVASTNLPFRRINGCVRRSGWLLAWKPKKPAGAEVAVVPSGSVCGIHLDQFIVLGLHGDPAAVAAEGADRVGPLEHPGAVLVHGEPARDGADRADLDAAAAEFAVEFVRAEVFDLGHGAAAHRSQRLHVHDFIAIPDATQTLHAAVHLRFDERAEVLFLEDAFGFREPAGRRRCIDARKSWRSHLPPWSQTGQSSGWLARMNSSTDLWASSTVVVAVRTAMPSATGVLQAVWSFGIFSTSTRHIRQLASGFSLGW